MKTVYNHASRAINRIDCALHQCVRVIPVPAWMLKRGSLQKGTTSEKEQVEILLCDLSTRA